MTKVRCNQIHCDYEDEGVCTRGSIALYSGDCQSLKISRDYDSYDDEE